ncbi:MAG: DVUA0089 family protein, partial [Candidatus Bipolaricaulia bacterium]
MRSILVICCLVAVFSALGVASDSFETPISLGTLTGNGELTNTGMSIDPESDVDHFAFEITVGMDVTIETAGSLGGDTVLTLYDGDRQVIAEDDDGGNAAYSRIHVADLGPGEYYVLVSAYGKSGTIDDYSITVTGSGVVDDDSYGGGISEGVAASQDKTDFLRRIALALEAEGWTVRAWPSDEKTFVAVEQDDTFTFVFTCSYHDATLSRLIVHSVFSGNPEIDRSRLQAVNDLNGAYNVTKVSLDDDGDVWCEVHYPVHGSVDPALLSAFLTWYDEALEVFLATNHEA